MNKFVIFLVVGCLLVGGLPAMAQDGNLLENPGFETPFNTVDGDPPREVAQGWTPWHIPAADGSPSFANRQPEYLPTAPDTTRILEGSDAQLLSSFFATHDGGVLQRVTGVTSGASLRFSVFAYVWSTTFDDLDLSDQDGDVFVQVGIDPTGGTDPESDAIVWSAPGVEQYDAYNEYQVSADAASDAVTVFVRTTIGIPVKNNNIYLDQASLSAEAEAPVASDTPVTPSATPITPSATPITPTEDNSLQLTATALVAEATRIAETAAAEVNAQLTATAASEATSTAQAVLTATAAVTTPAPTATATATATPTRPGPISEEFPHTITHTVQRGETVAILAARYGSSISAIAEANGLGSNYLIRVGQSLIIPVRVPNPAPPTPTRPVVITATPEGDDNMPPTTGEIYIVQRGDTLFHIAQRFNTSISAIAQLNGIVNVDRIQAGQRLMIPGTPRPNPPTAVPGPTTQTYLVLPGDTLSRISLRFDVPISRIARANNIVNWNWIFAGQRLIIP